MLTGLTDDGTMLASIQAGADAYVTKYRALAEVVTLVRSAAAGDLLIEPDVIAVIAQRVSEIKEQDPDRLAAKPLTYRELQVLRPLAQGLSTAETCRRLNIGPRTVGAHVRNLTAKLGVHSRLEAVAFAHRHRLVEGEPDPDRR